MTFAISVLFILAVIGAFMIWLQRFEVDLNDQKHTREIERLKKTRDLHAQYIDRLEAQVKHLRAYHIAADSLRDSYTDAIKKG